MARPDVDEAIQKGLEVWSKVTPLTFTKISKGIADIMIAFRTRGKVFSRESNIAIFILGALTRLIFFPRCFPVHGRCPRYFDGPLGVLGHAFPPGPGLGGDTHFDEDENWTKDGVGKSNFLYEQNVTIHQIPERNSFAISCFLLPSFPMMFHIPDDADESVQYLYRQLCLYSSQLYPHSTFIKPLILLWSEHSSLTHMFFHTSAMLEGPLCVWNYARCRADHKVVLEKFRASWSWVMYKA